MRLEIVRVKSASRLISSLTSSFAGTLACSSRLRTTILGRGLAALIVCSLPPSVAPPPAVLSPAPLLSRSPSAGRDSLRAPHGESPSPVRAAGAPFHALCASFPARAGLCSRQPAIQLPFAALPSPAAWPPSRYRRC